MDDDAIKRAGAVFVMRTPLGTYETGTITPHQIGDVIAVKYGNSMVGFIIEEVPL